MVKRILHGQIGQYGGSKLQAYEILPPREKDGTLNSYAETISSLLSQTHIDAINIPEVNDEIGRGERPVSNQKRGEPRKFGMLLQDIVGVFFLIDLIQ